MAEVIHLNLRCSAEAVVAHAQSEVERRRGRFNGNVLAGSFTLPAVTTLSGSYRIIGRSLEIRIAHRSALLSRADIVRYLREELAALELEQTTELPEPRAANHWPAGTNAQPAY